MKKIFVLYGVRKENPDWQEEVIIARKGKYFSSFNLLFVNAKRWAEENGFDRFRLAEYGGGTSENITNSFIKAINI